MVQPPYRSFSDSAGRRWRVTELFPRVLATELAGSVGVSPDPISLLFVSGSDKRWVTAAPLDWHDVSTERLGELLEHAREFPYWIGSFLGLFDE